MSQRIYKGVLEEGYTLHWYEIRSVLGRGAFGVTYLAHDQNLDRLVAIKEYFPQDYATREQGETVHPSTGEHKAMYEWGLDRFIKEARVLAQFAHANVVRVFSVFEDNGTAYMIMEYEHGLDLASYYKEQTHIGERRLLDIFLPILDGLKGVHEAGFIHRDIKPANIFLRENATPVLIDFGAARQTRGTSSEALTSLITPGYAPFEQHNEGNEDQGPWTDIYALGACLYLAVTGKLPETALARGSALLAKRPDPYTPVSFATREGYSQAFLRAIDHALMFYVSDRPRDVTHWSDMLRGQLMPEPLSREVYGLPGQECEDKTLVMPDSGVQDGDSTVIHPPSKHRTKKSARALQRLRHPRALLAVGLAVVLITAALGLYLHLVDKAEKARLAQETRQRIESLYAQADTASRAGHLYDPADENAVHYYTRILHIDPAQEDARKARRRLLDRYTDSIEQWIAQGQVREAEAAYQNLKALAPEEPGLAELGDSLRRAAIQHEHIEHLLQAAGADLDAGRVLRPQGKNALEKYREVLSLVAEHPKALQGIEAVIDELASRAEHDIQRRRFRQARDRIGEIAQIDENAAALPHLRADLAKAKRPPPHKPEKEAAQALVKKYKRAFEARDIDALQRISRFNPGRREFLEQFFAEYRSFRLNTSRLRYAKSSQTGHVRVAIEDLVNKNGAEVQPAAWNRFDIELKKNGGRWKVYW